MALHRPTGAPGLVMVPCIVEIDHICRNEEIISMWAGRPRIDCIVIREIQYQFEVNWCTNEEIIVKGNFGWVCSMWAGRPRVGIVAMHKVRYQLEVNLCRNEEIIVKGNFGWVWSMWAGRPRVGNGAMHTCNVQYQFEVNRCRNEEVNLQGSSAYSDGRRR
ncbi:hypothetical protein DPMN_155663 [Dreissena polymorpha]|uniref:Uncharacterized protein n=1 Tax=Dreissena polymorpha TaxID=45954 RepID=A0A9D4JBK5_DREPO|nr:hypothetical protein DPMN_155663 [Dreissena polymorpha]